MKNSGNIFISIIVAAAAGVVIGLLVAPEKGEDLRRSIKDTAGDWKRKFSDLLDEGEEQYKSIRSTLVEGVDGFKSDVKSGKA